MTYVNEHYKRRNGNLYIDPHYIAPVNKKLDKPWDNSDKSSGWALPSQHMTG